MSVTHYQSESRYEFGLKLLDLALSQLDAPYEIRKSPGPEVNEGRGERQVLTGDVDLQWLLTTPEREEKFIPIRVPIYRGILGLRLLLVSRIMAEQMSQIQNLTDLQHYTGGHGRHWSDLSVFAANSLPVVTNVNYEALFTQLALGDFDYFHRGINEVWAELKRHEDSLVVADEVMLFYPNPVFFFVNKSRPELAKKIELGLKKAQSNGRYKALFIEFHTEMIRLGQLENRRLIRLKNPRFSEGIKEIDTSWWLPETLQMKFTSPILP